MVMDPQKVMEILGALEAKEVSYALVGGIALGFHGLIRTTRDIDLFVSPDPQNVERLRAALDSVFNDPSLEQITAEDLGGDYPAVQYVPPSGDFHIDIVARLGEAFCFEDIETEGILVEGVKVRIATARMLVKMKQNTVRHQDRVDAAALRERFGIEEEP